MTIRIFHLQKKITTTQVIVFGFAAVILIGTLLLMLPAASSADEPVSFIDAAFTSTTSVCVTGLVVHDTGTYWSGFGQAVILGLVQIGGMGVITVAVGFVMLSGRKIGLMQRTTMKEAVAAPKISGIVRLTGFIVKTTLVIELLGALALMPVFCRDFGVLKGIWMSVFHSISAFCNAGIDLMGIREPFSSLTGYISSVTVNLVVMMLIITGGIGFLTWDDIRTHGRQLKRYRMQSKVILVTTSALILVPAMVFFIWEFQDLPLKERVLASFFQAVTPRTAGFNTVNLTELSDSAGIFTIVLMLIGGSPGSTAGGMKTTTLAVLAACTVAVFQRKSSAEMFGRRISVSAVYSAAAIAFLYVSLCVGCAMIISQIESLPILTCLYETASAVGTVGLTMGITPGLGAVSKGILILLMFFGRVGGLTLIYAALAGSRIREGKLPEEKITVG